MRESRYIDGAGEVHKSLLVISASSSCVLRCSFEALVDKITCSLGPLKPAKLPRKAATGLLLLIAATISGVTPWSERPE